jgi:hypothetical protein
MMMSKGCVWALAILALTFGPLACGDSEDSPGKAPAAEAGASDDASEDGRAARGERISRADPPGTANSGSDALEAVALPESFPTDVPIFPDATPTASLVKEGGDSVVSLNTAAPAPEVFDYYRAALENRGWDIESETAGDIQGALIMKKGARTATVLILASHAGTQIVLTVAEE